MAQPARSTVDTERRPRLWWMYGAIWLVYLTEPLNAALGHRHGAARDLGVVALFAFAAAYLAVLVRGRRRGFAPARPSLTVAWAEVAGLALLAVATVPAAHEHAFAAFVFVAAAAMFTLPTRQAWGVVIVLASGTVLAVRLVHGWNDTGAGLGIVLAAVAISAIRLAFERNRSLVQAQDEMAQLAVTTERSRFARDLHDILGHSLTVITVKAELAGRLLRDDPDRAAAEIADVERLSRDALADVRRAVAGYREVTLTTELASARQSLAAAGIDAHISAAVDDVPTQLRELYGWVVREGVTNVIRHSNARLCEIRADARGVEVVDDGVGATGGAGGPGPGHGLAGLAERAAGAGARLTAGPRPRGGFGLRLTLVDATDAAGATEADPARAGRR
jgi:two-component system sensor histidine kinase DesK